MAEQERLELEESEAVVVDAASRILASYISIGACAPGNEEQMIKKAVDAAIGVAKEVDARVSADGEVASSLSSNKDYRPLG